VALTDLPDATASTIVRRIGESLQTDLDLLAALERAGVKPGATVGVSWAGDRVSIGTGDETAELDRDGAAHLFVSRT
jgi:DtxR family transcriptional regulator, Mn-dependent transcriptional regulator